MRPISSKRTTKAGRQSYRVSLLLWKGQIDSVRWIPFVHLVLLRVLRFFF